jgi:hypothetical protein
MCFPKPILAGAMDGSGASAPTTRTTSRGRTGPIAALSGVFLVLLAATATGAPVTTRGALAARSPRPVPRHGQRRNLHEAAGRVRVGIVGGQEAPAGSFPWLAFIEDDLGGGNYDLCTGTVVSSSVVLTAGHCAEDITTGTHDPASGFAVVTGALDWADTATGQVSGVSQTAVYPSFDPNTLHGDAAVLELSTPTTAPAIPLATTSSFLVPGARDAMAGWGRSYRCQVRLRVIPKPGAPHMMVVATGLGCGWPSARSARRVL